MLFDVFLDEEEVFDGDRFEDLPECAVLECLVPSGEAPGGLFALFACDLSHGGFPSLFAVALVEDPLNLPFDFLGGHVEANGSAVGAADFGAVEASVVSGEPAFEDPC